MDRDGVKKNVQLMTEEAQRLAQSIVETVREPLVVLDADLRVRFANRSFYRTFQVEREATEGLSLFALGNGQWDIAQLHTLLAELLPQNGQFEDFEVQWAFPAIGHKVMLLNARCLYDDAGRAKMILLAMEDVTERRQAEERLKDFATRLERSNRELQDFASVASHDLQEPLRKIQAFGYRLKVRSHDALGEEERDYLGRMLNAASRMQTLINDVLMFSRVETRVRPFARVDLTAVAHEVICDLEIQVERAGARVEVATLPAIEADPLQMRQLLQNLIGNSLKYRRADCPPLVKVYATLTDGRDAPPMAAPADYRLCHLHVEDDGIGFDEKYLDRIFKVFQRLHGRREYDGTGIGLAVCRKIAERHHGHITATSSPGNGATFIVTLPMKQHGGVETQ